jgi:hypothetical protein
MAKAHTGAAAVFFDEPWRNAFVGARPPIALPGAGLLAGDFKPPLPTREPLSDLRTFIDKDKRNPGAHDLNFRGGELPPPSPPSIDSRRAT